MYYYVAYYTIIYLFICVLYLLIPSVYITSSSDISVKKNSSLIAMARTTKTVLSKSGESGHPYLVPDLSRNHFRFSLLRMM